MLQRQNAAFACLCVALGVSGFAPVAVEAATGYRSYEIAISRAEMLEPDGTLQPRAIEALKRVAADAVARSAQMRVQVPSDAVASVPLIRDAAPPARIQIVSSRHPYKLVLSTANTSPSGANAGPAGGAAEQPLPVVVIHMQHELQDEVAEQCAERLKRAGARISDKRVLVPSGPRSSQLRYFHPQDRKEAHALAQALGSIGVRVALLNLSAPYRETVPPRRYELWLAPA